jgi:hypothetical protein
MRYPVYSFSAKEEYTRIKFGTGVDSVDKENKMWLYLLACGSNKEVQVSPPIEEIQEVREASPDSECFSSCMKSSQAEARSIEAIEADCRASCSDQKLNTLESEKQ